MREDQSQRDLFDEEQWRKTFRVVDKLPEVALANIRAKYYDKFRMTDLHFFLGTTQRWHGSLPALRS